MRVPRLNIIYIAALVVLGLLVAVTFIRPLAGGKHYSAIQNENLLKIEAGWILQFNLVNQYPQDTSYTIRVVTGVYTPYQQQVTVPKGGTYGFAYHIYAKDIPADSTASVTIFKEQETVPLEEETFHLQSQMP